jgi:TPP-dependent pyruvate/acetoin dehydrogenase alpha subunit
VSTSVTQTPHGALGLGDQDLLAMHRTLLTARLLDEAALRQNRMGRAPFVVPVSGADG